MIATFLAKALAEHPDIQERLREEMIEMRSRIGDGDLTYDLLNEMKYAGMVINEGLRLCPIVTELKWRCTKTYDLENSNGGKVTVQPGEAVWLPSYTLQNDPQYYPNPSILINSTLKIANLM